MASILSEVLVSLLTEVHAAYYALLCTKIMAQAIPQHPANQKMDPARVSLTPGNVQLLNPLEIVPYHTLKR